MRDALGGTVALVIIVVFIVIALGYMAFNVNYTKAFRMKDKIITLYENYDGNCNSECESKITDYAKSIGYESVKGNWCSGTPKISGLYCEKAVNVSGQKCSKGVACDLKDRRYFHIETRVNIDIPIIRNVLPIDVFTVSGDTKTMVVK